MKLWKCVPNSVGKGSQEAFPKQIIRKLIYLKEEKAFEGKQRKLFLQQEQHEDIDVQKKTPDVEQKSK